MSNSLIRPSKSDFVILDYDEKLEKGKLPPLPLVPSKVSDGRIFYSSHLVDPNGLQVGDNDVRTFMIAGEMSNGKSQRKPKGNGTFIKAPKLGCKTFGNENIPLIAKHINPLKNYMFSQFLPVSITFSPTSVTPVNHSWTLSQMDGISAYTSLYDQYCIRFIEVWYLPAETEQTTLQKAPIQLYTAYDPDGSSVTTLADIRQYDDLVISPATSGQYVCFKPSVAVATYGGAFTKYSFLQDQWCDVVNTDITHYGLVHCYDAAAAANDFQHGMNVRMWVEFRGVR